MSFLEIDINLQNVADSQGLGIALTGMVIVFSALTLITLFITFLPKVLAVLTDTAPAPQVWEPDKAPTAEVQEDEEIVAAIGYVLHHHSQRPS